MVGIKARIVLRRKDFLLDVDFEISEPQIVVIHGESGSGKTTLLRCIAGLEKADEAYLAVNGVLWHDTRNNFFLPTHLRKVGYVAQKNNLFPHLSVKENLLFGHGRVGESAQKVSCEQAVEWLRIENLLERNVAKLSGGETQRVAIARALLTDPDVLLLDEPLSAVDRKNKTEILGLIKNLKSQLSLPIIYVSHLSDETEYLADKTVKLFPEILA